MRTCSALCSSLCQVGACRGVLTLLRRTLLAAQAGPVQANAAMPRLAATAACGRPSRQSLSSRLARRGRIASACSDALRPSMIRLAASIDLLAQLCSFCRRDACSPADERPAEPGPAPGVEAHGCELERRGAWQPRAGRVLRQRRPHLPSSGSCGPLGAGKARCDCSASRARPRARAMRSGKAASATVVCLAAQVVGLDFAAEMLDDAAQREAAARQRRRRSAGIRWVQVGC